MYQRGILVGCNGRGVDLSYLVAMNFIFPDKQAQDDYQVHPEHVKFVEQCRSLWQKVTVYDFA